MQNRGHDDSVSALRVEDGVWKAVEERAPQLAINWRVQGRVVLDRREGLIESRSKLQTQAGPLLFVPLSCCGDVILGLRTQSEPTAHFPGQMRPRTSGHDEPSAGFFSMASSRRSSSAFCSSVSGKASG